MRNTDKQRYLTLALIAAACFSAQTATADVVTDWNTRANDIVAAAKLPPPPAYRVMAIVQVSVYEAVNAITRRYTSDRVKLGAAPSASIEAAVASANRTVLAALVPAQQTGIESAYQAALANIPSGEKKTAGILLGKLAAEAILAQRADDGAGASESYRPRTSAGNYVPTVIPATPQWPQRKPWVMRSADQFRPGPPPDLKDELWARDYNEIRELGARDSQKRSAMQSEIARFWEATGPAIYFPVVLSVANASRREVTRNARLLAMAGIAMDEALIAVMDAKYHYHFWRPMTAIRNGDIDDNDATPRDATWTPLVSTPMHPEYPCAHCILAASVGAVLRSEIGNGPVPILTTSSVTANGASRSWSRIEDFVQEVANARIYDGVHYRNSTQVGSEMGKKVGELVAQQYWIAMW